MKLFILLIISFFLFLFSGEKKYNDLMWDNLKGKVKLVVISEYKIEIKKGKDTIKSFQNIITTKYDSNGNKIERTARIGDSLMAAVDSLDTYKNIYDKNGNAIEKKVFSALFSSFGDQDLYYYYTYDERGRLIGDTGRDIVGLSHSGSCYYYDSKNNLIEVDTKDHYSMNKFINKYDDKNNMIELDHYYEGNILEKFMYNSSGDVIELFSTYGQGGSGSIGHYKSYLYKSYDAEKNWLKRFDYGKKETLMEIRRIEYY